MKNKDQKKRNQIDLIGYVGIISTFYMFYALIYKQIGTRCGVFGPFMRVLFMSSLVGIATSRMDPQLSTLINSAFIVYVSSHFLKEERV